MVHGLGFIASSEEGLEFAMPGDEDIVCVAYPELDFVRVSFNQFLFKFSHEDTTVGGDKMLPIGDSPCLYVELTIKFKGIVTCYHAA